MHTILGANGTIGSELAKHLSALGQRVRLVSRNPRRVNIGDELMSADLMEGAAVDRAVAGSSVAYLVVGLEYKTKVWRAKWPLLMRRVVTACEKHGSKLVFFDNVYGYAPSAISHMTEASPLEPISEKGQIRAEVVRIVLDAVEEGRLRALIARSADFYGPNSGGKSVLIETVYERLRQRKKAVWLGDPDRKHSFTFTPDAARATALLGNSDDAFDQVWHLPTAADPPTAREWTELFARELGVEPGVRAVPQWLVGALGIFVPFLSELREMLYQYDRDYVFDSSKFERRFAFQPTPYASGVQQIVAGTAREAPPASTVATPTRATYSADQAPPQ